jgi:hypothetical protein
MKLVRKRLTYANVMSSIAVFLVVAGGSALAANQLGKNTVGTKQLKKNAVTAAKIKNGAVTGAKVNLSTLGTVPSATNATNSKTADTAKSAETAKSADTAKTADTAKSADTAKTATTANSAQNAASATIANSAFSENSGEDVLPFNGSANVPTTVATLALPAGNYFLLGKVLINNNALATATANCALSAGGTVVDSGFDNTRVSKEGGEADRQYLVVSGVASLPNAATVTVNCRASSTEGNWLDRTLSAIQVRAIG